jgi:hypothetical protein
MHIARLEKFNRDLSEANDSLRRELTEEREGRRAA